MAEEFYSFEKALKELRLRSEELKRLVSEGEIPALRERDTMKFRKADVEALARSRGAEDDEGAEDLVFADEERADDQGMVTAELSDDDTLLAEDEEIEEIEEEITVGGAPPSRAQARPKAPVLKTTRSQQIRQKAAKEESVWPVGVAVVTSVLLVYGIFVVQSIATVQNTGITSWLVNMFQR